MMQADELLLEIDALRDRLSRMSASSLRVPGLSSRWHNDA